MKSVWRNISLFENIPYMGTSSANSLFIYQDENEYKDKNQSYRSFLYVLKQTCDEQTNN